MRTFWRVKKAASVSASTALAFSIMAAPASVQKSTTPGPVPDDAGAKTHHVTDRHGKTVRFQNPHPSSQFPSPWKRFTHLFHVLTGADKAPQVTGQEMTVVPAQFLPGRTAESLAGGSLRATWLGHACYYVEFPSGLRVLFDPVLEDFCSPIHFSVWKRYSRPPCDIASLPYVDAVVISHSHYDHLSSGSVQEVHKHHPNAHFFVGLGLKSWFEKSGIKEVTEMDWWEDAELTFTPAQKGPEKTSDGPITARISCLPSQHTSGRSAFDQNATLWASWAVSSGGKSVWFAGDTGYRTVPQLPEGTDDYGPQYDNLPICPQFKQIGDLRGPFDLGLFPIGAYKPRWVWSAVHANPFDSVNMFVDTKCKKGLAMHWGTWVLTIEEVMQPPKLLREALKRKGIAETGVFDVVNVGESREF